MVYGVYGVQYRVCVLYTVYMVHMLCCVYGAYVVLCIWCICCAVYMVRMLCCVYDHSTVPLSYLQVHILPPGRWCVDCVVGVFIVLVCSLCWCVDCVGVFCVVFVLIIYIHSHPHNLIPSCTIVT